MSHYDFLVIVPDEFGNNTEAIWKKAEELADPFCNDSFLKNTGAETFREWEQRYGQDMERFYREVNVLPHFDYYYVSNDLPAPGWVKVSEIPDDYVPEAVITPEGHWYWDEERHFWAQRNDPNWLELYRMLLRDYPNHIAVSMGGHF